MRTDPVYVKKVQAQLNSYYNPLPLSARQSKRVTSQAATSRQAETTFNAQKASVRNITSQDGGGNRPFHIQVEGGDGQGKSSIFNLHNKKSSLNDHRNVDVYDENQSHMMPQIGVADNLKKRLGVVHQDRRSHIRTTDEIEELEQSDQLS